MPRPAQYPPNPTTIGGGGSVQIVPGPPRTSPLTPPTQGGAPAAAAPSTTLNAEMYQPLTALQGRYDKYLNNLESGTGQIMDQAGQRFRDAREGGRQSLIQGQGIRGVGSSNQLAGYEAGTQRGVQSAVADMANARTQMLGGALQGGVGVMGAPAELSLKERGLGLQAAQLNEQTQMNNFNRFLALLNAQRQSPIYSGGGPSF